MAVDLGGEQRRREIVSGASPGPLGHLPRIDEHLDRGELSVVGGGLELRVVEADQAVGEIVDAGPVLVGNAHHLADHLHREVGGHVGDEVARSLLTHPVDDAAGHPLYARKQRLHHARGEGLVDQAPEAAVLGRVHVEQEGPHLRQRLRVEVGDVRPAPRGREELRVLGDEGHVGVPGHDPEAGPFRLRMERDGSFAA